MLNLLKKVEESRQDVGDIKSNGFEPPKNLPDLAKDMYEREQLVDTVSASGTVDNSINNPLISSKVSEPSKIFVPKLDLSLVRSQSASSKNPSYNTVSDSKFATSTIAPQIALPFAQQSLTSQSQSLSQQSLDQQNMLTNQLLQQILQNFLNQQLHSQQSNSPYLSYPQVNPSLLQQSYLQPAQQPIISETINVASNTSGFFKEFEDYIKDNGLNNEIIEVLFDKNLLDHMVFYHTLKTEGTAFYNSSAEFSSAIKLRLEELQNLERNWTVNKHKLDLLKKLGLAMESDVHLKSEELKKMIIESKKIGNVAKSNNFFQLLQPKSSIYPTKSDSNVLNVTSSDSSSNFLNTPPNNSLDISSTSYTAEPSNVLSKPTLTSYIILDPSNYFYAQNGQVFKSLNDLILGLELMDDGTFNYHVNSTKNDFSNWIKHIFSDTTLSESIKFLMTKDKLLSRLKYLVK